MIHRYKKFRVSDRWGFTSNQQSTKRSKRQIWNMLFLNSWDKAGNARNCDYMDHLHFTLTSCTDNTNTIAGRVCLGSVWSNTEEPYKYLYQLLYENTQLKSEGNPKSCLVNEYWKCFCCKYTLVCTLCNQALLCLLADGVKRLLTSYCPVLSLTKQLLHSPWQLYRIKIFCGKGRGATTEILKWENEEGAKYYTAACTWRYEFLCFYI